MIVGDNPNRETIRCIIDIAPAELEELRSCCDQWEEDGQIYSSDLPKVRVIGRILDAIAWCRSNLPQNKESVDNSEDKA